MFDASYCGEISTQQSAKIVRGESEFRYLHDIISNECSPHYQLLKQNIEYLAEVVPHSKRYEFGASILQQCSPIDFTMAERAELEGLLLQGHHYQLTYQLFKHAIIHSKINSKTYIRQILFEEAVGESFDHPSRLKLIEQSAKLGYGLACLELGNIHFSGTNSISIDYEKAYYYFSKANNHPIALWSLGWMYEKGFYVQQSYEEALNYYHKAASKGYPKAYNSLGKFYARGFVPNSESELQTLRKALKWLRKAARCGNISALINLAALYEQRANYKNNLSLLKKAIELYTLAADHGDIRAQNKLGELYFYQPYPELCSRDLHKAERYFRASATQDGRSCYHLGKLLKLRHHNPDNPVEEAIYFLRKALTLGISEAAYELAKIYVEPPFHDYINPPQVCYEIATQLLTLHLDTMNADTRNAAERLMKALDKGVGIH